MRAHVVALMFYVIKKRVAFNCSKYFALSIVASTAISLFQKDSPIEYHFFRVVISTI